MSAIMLSLTFTYGMDCSIIAELPRQELERLIWDLDLATESFCRPEDNFECADYAALVSEFGTLLPAQDGTTCRFQFTRTTSRREQRL